MAGNGGNDQDWRRRIDDTLNDALVDARNEVIVQGANLFLAGRRILLVGAGLAMLSADQVQMLIRRAAERGEVMEQDALTAIDRLRQRGSGGDERVPSAPKR